MAKQKKSKTKTYIMKLGFLWYDDDIEDDIHEFKLTVPKNVKKKEVKKVLLNEYKFLYVKDETDLQYNEDDLRNKYSTCPVTLLCYVCKKYNWEWDFYKFDIDINFTVC